MKYEIKKVAPDSQQAMIDFLKKHENYTLFLLSNFENYGSKLTDSPYSGNFKIITYQEKVVGVFCLTRKGNLLIETVLQESIFESVINACYQEPIPLKGIVGNFRFCEPFWEYLKTKKIIKKETYIAREILYNIELAKHDYISQPHVRLLNEEDYIQWKPLRLDYLKESGIPQDLTEKQLFDIFLEKIHKKISWGLFLNGSLISMADLNAKTGDLGQVGGVYTKPHFRQRGYSKSVMQKLLLDAKELHKIRKIIIFTEEKNFPAQNLYLSLGASEIGHYALLFGDS